MGGFFGGGGGLSTFAPKIGALNIQTSAFGMAVPLVYGQTRIPANLVWYGDFVAIPHTTTQSSGGKGGGGAESSNTTYTYTAAVAMGLCEGQIAAIGSVWAGKEVTTLAALGLSLFTGSNPQTAWGYLTTNHPSEAIGYQSLAYVASSAYDLGGSAMLPNHTFEVKALLNYSPATGFNGAKPDLLLINYLTGAQYGAGFAAAKIGSLTQYANYCMAAGILLSPAYTSQSAANTHLDEIMLATNAALVWSEGLLKVIPCGDTAITGPWGVNYTPDNTVRYDLGDDDFLGDAGSDPVAVTRKTQADAFNQVQIEFLDSANQYNVAIATASDLANIELYGLRPQSPLKLHGITRLETAQTVAQFVLQRALYIRNRYDFTLGIRYSLLEPMDIVTLTDAALGLALTPVRIVEIEETADGEFNVVAEEFLAGVSHAGTYPSQAGAGYQVNYNASPGEVVAPLIFEAPVEKTSTTGLGIYVATTGQSSLWGGCNVWVSLDGTTYKQQGTLHGGARYGALTAPLAAAPAGSDITNTLAVALAGTGGQMLSGTAADAELLNTLCYVDGEYLSYVTATLTGANAYSLTNLMRAAYTTPSGLHASGAPFARIDEALPLVELDPAYIGKQLWFKFTSFNIYGSAGTSLAGATAYPYTVTGAMIKLPPPRVDTFLVNVQADGTRQFTWNYNAAPPVDVTNGGGYRIKYYLGSTADWDAMTDAHPTGLLTFSPFENNQLAAGTYTFAIKAVDVLGNESAAANFIGATLTDPRLGNVLVQRMERMLGWPGTITGGFKYNGSIYAISSTTIAGLPATIAALSGAIDTVGTNTSPITYVTPVMDLGVNTSFTPLASPTVQGTPTLTMKTGTAADGGVVGSWVPLANVSGKRYVQIQLSVADAAPRMDELVVLLDGDTQADEFNDVNAATETSAWFYKVATGHIRIGSKSGKMAAISQATIAALQNTGGAWTWELVNKTSTVNGQPAAEFKIRNASGTLADALIDVVLKGPRS